MSNFDAGGFDDFAPAAGAARDDFPRRRDSAADFPRRGDRTATEDFPRRARPRDDGAVGHRASIPETPVRDRPPAWQPDAACDACPTCRARFETFARRHHCRYCGGIFCYACTSRAALMPPQWEGLCGYATRDPQKVCGACSGILQPFQQTWIDENSNQHKANRIDDDASTRYLNSPLRFTLGGEVRKAGITLRNLLGDNANFWEKDAQVFHDQLSGARGLLFLTIAKMAMIGGLRVGTGLVVAKLPDGSWGAPCAVGTLGLSFGAMFGIGISDTVTALDDTALTELADAHTTKISLGVDASLALGPLGRSASGELLGASDASATTQTTYSQTRGFYGGISLNGANLRVRDDVNLKFYGKKVAPADVLRGRVAQPPAARCLYEELGAFFGELEARRRRSAARQAYEYQSQRSAPSGGDDPSGGGAGDPFGADPVVEV